MISRDTRREENQKLSRHGNESLLAVVGDEIPETRLVPFLCECAAEYCDGRVEVSMEAWEDVAAEPHHFLMVSGHEKSEGENVVSALGEYEIVEKPS